MNRSASVVAVALASLGACSTAHPASDAGPGPAAGPSTRAFMYQTVGIGRNAVRAGFTTDGYSVASADVDLAVWNAMGMSRAYQDPVFSRLPDGDWIMTARSSRSDPRGGGALMIHQGPCPTVDDEAVIVLSPSAEAGCATRSRILEAKSSQVFDHAGRQYVFVMAAREILLVQLADASHAATELLAICVRDDVPAAAADLAWGDAVPVLRAPITDGLFVSDTAIVQRPDGSWVLFVKGIEDAAMRGCTAGGLCELCGRGIYRTESADLLAWSPLERVVSRASIPEATRDAEGRVWLYWQDFSRACDADDLSLAGRSAISGAYETADGSLSAPQPVVFPDEAFEVDALMHYATNGNPVYLPDDGAVSALEACLASGG